MVVVSETGETSISDDIDEMVEEALTSGETIQDFDNETVQQAVNEITADKSEVIQQDDVSDSYQNVSNELNDKYTEE